MKITTVLLMTGIFNVIASSSYSQSTKVSLNLKNTTVENVLNEIEKKSEFYFLFNQKLVDVTRNVSVVAQNKSISEVLTGMFKDKDVAYMVFDKQIILVPKANVKSMAAIQQNQITGTVTDVATGESLPGVSITVAGTTKGVITDLNGKYSIEVPDQDAVLVFSFVGYVSEKIKTGGQSTINVKLTSDIKNLEEVVVVGYGTQKKEAITGSISNISSKDIDRVHGGSTVSTSLAGKIAGVSFRQAEGRPGASASIQIRNLGTPLYVIDGIEKDEGQFNNIAPNDIESISVLKDASAAIYGVKAANGVVVVTTKTGKLGTKSTINVNAFTGWQTWTRWPKTTNAYEWMLGKADAEMNQYGTTTIAPADLDKWKAGTETGYKSFDWYKFIVKPNAPLTQLNVNANGGSDRITYYLSLTRLDQNSVLGREFTFGRTNIQSNVDAKVTNRIKVGMHINGRIESRKNPGVPGGDDYWAPRFALMRNRPTERPFANDNPLYLNDIGHNDTNWGLLNFQKSGYWQEDWRVLQTNFTADYETPIKGLTAKGMYSYYIADRLMNGHEYTYDAYTYYPTTDTYVRTGGSTNPWRERGTHKVLENVYQGQLNYNNTFGKHTIGATFVSEWTNREDLDVWVHAVPKTNALPLIQFTDVDTYNDRDVNIARIGYIGRVNYNYDNKYYVEVAGRQDASWKFADGKRWGTFPSVSAGWRITNEGFMKSLLGSSTILTDLKFRGSYGVMGDDNNGIPDDKFTYISGYDYAASKFVNDGQVITDSRDRGPAFSNYSWFKSKMKNIGADFTMFDGKLSGSLDYFKRKRTGLMANKYDVVPPKELGYDLPQENLNSDENFGGEGALQYKNKIGKLNYTIGGNLSYARNKFLDSYKPRFGNSWNYYRSSGENRYTGIFWGYECVGQFQSKAQIDNYNVDIDGQGNRTLLPGDLIYKDINGDGKIDDYDMRPIGYPGGSTPMLNFGFNIALNWNNFDFHADFSGASGYSWNRNWEMRWPYQNGGALLQDFYNDRWHRENPFDLNSKWVSGKYPALRFNNGGHSDYRNSTFWLYNVRYLRARTIELGYTLPKNVLNAIKITSARFYVNGYNLFTFDNLKDVGIDPETADENGLQYPQSRYINVGFNLTF
ncbi:MAG: TonB-dependent receptor [Bacteroidota bacterium]|nr:TonB-dependent receptor [Bacteroidota bacterium]